jgi:hypothetical protein
VGESPVGKRLFLREAKRPIQVLDPRFLGRYPTNVAQSALTPRPQTLIGPAKPLPKQTGIIMRTKGIVGRFVGKFQSPNLGLDAELIVRQRSFQPSLEKGQVPVDRVG